MKVYGKLWSFVLVVALLCPMISLMSVSATVAVSPNASDTLSVTTAMKTVRVDFYMTTTEAVEDFEGYIQYDPEYLTYTSDDDLVVDESVKNPLINTGKSGYIYFSAYDIDYGMNFATRTKVISAKFTIKKSGSAAVTSAITMADNMSDSIIVDADNDVNRGKIDTAVMINPLRFYSVSLSLASDLTFNYFVDSAAVSRYDSFYVIANGKTLSPESSTPDANSRYKFRLKGVNPCDADKDIYARLYGVKDGVVYYSDSLVYGVKTYCKTRLDRYESAASLTALQEKECGLLAHLMNYATAAQAYVGDTSTPINSFMTTQQAAWATCQLGTLNPVLARTNKISDAEVTWASLNVGITEAISMNFGFQLPAGVGLDGLTAEITNLDAGSTQSWVYDMSDVATLTSADQNKYMFVFKGLAATQMSTAVAVKFVKNNTVVSDTMQYSIDSTVSNQQNSSDALLANLVKEMRKYGRAAEAYWDTMYA